VGGVISKSSDLLTTHAGWWVIALSVYYKVTIGNISYSTGVIWAFIWRRRTSGAFTSCVYTLTNGTYPVAVYARMADSV
jgi:hypothetical protein